MASACYWKNIRSTLLSWLYTSLRHTVARGKTATREWPAVTAGYGIGGASEHGSFHVVARLFASVHDGYRILLNVVYVMLRGFTAYAGETPNNGGSQW